MFYLWIVCAVLSWTMILQLLLIYTINVYLSKSRVVWGFSFLSHAISNFDKSGSGYSVAVLTQHCRKWAYSYTQFRSENKQTSIILANHKGPRYVCPLISLGSHDAFSTERRVNNLRPTYGTLLPNSLLVCIVSALAMWLEIGEEE